MENSEAGRAELEKLFGERAFLVLCKNILSNFMKIDILLPENGKTFLNE